MFSWHVEALGSISSSYRKPQTNKETNKNPKVSILILHSEVENRATRGSVQTVDSRNTDLGQGSFVTAPQRPHSIDVHNDI
jgi:hypothetical protein